MSETINMKMANKTLVVRIGDTLSVSICGELLEGVVSDYGHHGSQFVIDLVCGGENRFCYPRQILAINGVNV